MIGAAIVLAVLAAMYWGACYFFRSCRGNKAWKGDPSSPDSPPGTAARRSEMRGDLPQRTQRAQRAERERETFNGERREDSVDRRDQIDEGTGV